MFLHEYPVNNYRNYISRVICAYSHQNNLINNIKTKDNRINLRSKNLKHIMTSNQSVFFIVIRSLVYNEYYLVNNNVNVCVQYKLNSSSKITSLSSEFYEY